MSAADHISKVQHARFVGDPASIPAPFGTQPVPEGMVRINHYTGEGTVESIREHGLLQSRNRDKVGDESFVFATAGHPGEDLLHRANIVEGYADPSYHGQLDIGSGREPESLEKNRSTVTLRGDLPPDQILAIHEPWHAHARYMATEGIGRPEDPDKPYAMGSTRSAVARGEHDDLETDPNYSRTYGPAIKATKITNAATVMLGGKL